MSTSMRQYGWQTVDVFNEEEREVEEEVVVEPWKKHSIRRSVHSERNATDAEATRLDFGVRSSIL